MSPLQAIDSADGGKAIVMGKASPRSIGDWSGRGLQGAGVIDYLSLNALFGIR
jgi:hypothetical protein